MKIVKLILKILLILVLVVLGLSTMAMAYIMFAPDNLPKPFYLMYAMPILPAATPTTTATVEETQSGETIDLQNLKPGQGLMVDTGSKIVNLVDPTGRKYLRVGVVLEFSPKDLKYYEMSEEEKKTFETTFDSEMAIKLPVINDILITLFSSQTYDTVYTAQGKENLRQGIKELINKQLPEENVINVYFTEFVVQ